MSEFKLTGDQIQIKKEFKVPAKLHTSSYREMKSKCKPAQTVFPQVIFNHRSKAYKRYLRESRS